MENRNYNDEKVLKMLERTVLVIFSGYSVVLLVVSCLLGWSVYVRELIALSLIVSWAACIRRFQTYDNRAVLISVLSWMNFVIYALHTDNFITIIPVMAGLIILLSIFCAPRIVYLGMFVSNGLFLYHGLLARTIPLDNADDVFRLVLHVLAVYTASFTAWLTIRIRMQISEKLYENIGRLERAEQSKDDFMVNISHEIRTPINAVCGMSEAILQEDIPVSVRKDVIDIQTAGRNLLSTVSNILDYSELESGDLELAEESYNITSTITDIINMALTLENGKKLEFVVDCDADLPSNLVGDEQKIRRIVVNLLENAIKFTKEGGVVLRIMSRKEEYGINLVVSVKDSGIGIKPADLEHVFTRFQQVDSKRNREEGGSGIGLAITKALVQKMGGFISVTSEPGVGSEFRFTIPQKVLDDTPIVSIKNRQQVFAACYINMSKYDYSVVREGYENCILHIAEQFGIMFRTCKSLSELKRRLEREKYTHIFISWDEYSEDKNFFEKLAQSYSVVLILDYGQEVRAGSNMLRIYKPFTVLSIAAVFNGRKVIQRDEQHTDLRHRFIAPDAKVLVVDDNAMNLKVMARLLLPYQIKVTMAGSGREALEKLDTMEFDCVFLDHMMPEMDGVETLHKIRQKPGSYFQSLSIIAFTANAIGGAREMFLAEGFNDFIAKPIELSVLERMLRRYIPVPKQIRLDAAEEAKGPDVPEGMSEGVILAQREESVVQEDLGAAQAERESVLAEQVEQKAEQLACLAGAGINIEQGLTFCGDEEGFREIVAMYHAEGPKRKYSLQHFFEEEDWKNYVIAVHALKSNSKGIGAEKVAALALNLEMAGKEDHIDYILEHHEELLEMHDALLDVIGANAFIYPEGTGESGEPSAGQPEHEADQEGGLVSMPFDQLLLQLEEQLEGFESEGINNLLDALQKSEPPQGASQETSPAKLAEQIREKVDDFDFLGASDILSSWKDARKG